MVLSMEIIEGWCQLSSSLLFFLSSQNPDFVLGSKVLRQVNPSPGWGRTTFRPKPVIWKFWYASESLRAFKTQNPGPHPQSFWFSRSRWGPRIYISNKFLGDADAPGLRTTYLKQTWLLGSSVLVFGLQLATPPNSGQRSKRGRLWRTPRKNVCFLGKSTVVGALPFDPTSSAVMWGAAVRSCCYHIVAVWTWQNDLQKSWPRAVTLLRS